VTAAGGGVRLLGNTCHHGDAKPADRCVSLPHASNCYVGVRSRSKFFHAGHEARRRLLTQTGLGDWL
jgi:hypothetical protein